MDRYTISDLEKLTGIMAGTIRIWERRYHIIKPHRTDTNRRWYDDDDLRRILNISLLYRKGIKISNIARLSGKEIDEKVALLTNEATDNVTYIDSLIVAMTELRENAINDVLMRSIVNISFEETITWVVFPFLRRVGFMWQTGSIDIGGEHFVTNIIRRRLITAIDSLPPPEKPDRKKVIMYLPEGELHEMGLLFYTYIVRKAGHETLYLGQATPVNALIDVVERWHPDILITGALTGLSFTKPEDYLWRISTLFKEKEILVSGALVQAAREKKYSNIHAVTSVEELKKHL
jgi:DNA-binding transcriptional MerR regulator